MEAFLDQARGLFNFWIVIALMMAGVFAVAARGNLIKKIVGLNIFQSSVFLFYISMGKIEGATAPILTGDPASV
jgi:multicomponent Na+:H+ antiporter subunit C